MLASFFLAAGWVPQGVKNLAARRRRSHWDSEGAAMAPCNVCFPKRKEHRSREGGKRLGPAQGCTASHRDSSQCRR